MKVSFEKIVNKLSTIFLTSNILLCLQAGSQAVTFTGTTNGEWGLPVMENPMAVVNISSENGGTNNRLTWGTPGMGGLNNYVQFNGMNFTTLPNDIFKVGELFYQNGSTLIETNFDGDFPLNLELALTLPLTRTESFEFLFNILNTPNITGDPVLDGDILQFATAGMSSQTFDYEGIEYTLQLIGFSTDDGQTILNEFNSPEWSISKAALYGKITFAPNPISVPEPTAIVGMSILSIYLATRQRK
jgi:hypothetical protein